MRYLIDTHTFLWFSNGDQALSQKAKNVILDANNTIFISIASLWEISIKMALGKLSIASNYADIIDDVTGNNIAILPINFAHTVQQNQLPLHHRDPFDRIIIAQAIVENLHILGKDVIFDDYLNEMPIKRIW